MSLLRALAGALLWLVALLLVIVAAVLCVTLLLLPLGIPLMASAIRLFWTGARLMMPRVVGKPVDEAAGALRTARGRPKKQGRRASNKVDTASRRPRGRRRRLFGKRRR